MPGRPHVDRSKRIVFEGRGAVLLTFSRGCGTMTNKDSFQKQSLRCTIGPTQTAH